MHVENGGVLPGPLDVAVQFPERVVILSVVAIAAATGKIAGCR
jgi:hypothetical protein